MEQTGWKDSLTLNLSKSYDSHLKVATTSEYILNKADTKNIANIIKDIGKSKDLVIILSAERVILRHEAQFYGTDNPQALKSINEAAKELDGAAKSLAVVQNKDKYQAANDTHSVKDKDRINGLPKDAFHIFSNSHKTRLGNRMRSIEASLEERLLLKERYNNMQIAQKEYMKLQGAALDIAE